MRRRASQDCAGLWKPGGGSLGLGSPSLGDRALVPPNCQEEIPVLPAARGTGFAPTCAFPSSSSEDAL